MGGAQNGQRSQQDSEGGREARGYGTGAEVSRIQREGGVRGVQNGHRSQQAL